MDQQKLRTLVFEKTGVKIDVDDPVFALVALNEAVLEEAVERHIAAMDAASAELVQSARAAAGLPPPQPAAAPAGLTATTAPSAFGIAPREWRLLAAAAAISLLTALLVLAGQAAFRPAGLSAAQTQSLHEAEKLKQAIGKLEPRLRAEVEAQLQK
ncbi:MAG: hypothetical protein ABW202_20770 [Duganella sp.]